MTRRERAVVSTPFGSTSLYVAGDAPTATVVLREENAAGGAQAVKAAIYGAKQLGAERIVEPLAAQPLDRLLPAAGYVVPHDLVDLTRGHYLTFFEHKGYGFLPQHTPFCPELRGALVPAVRAVDPLSAARGVVAAVSHWEQSDEARLWGAHLAARGVSPAAFLARELELCYVPLCLLGDREARVEQVVDDMLARLPAGRSCPCASAMQGARERGLVADDWRHWL